MSYLSKIFLNNIISRRHLIQPRYSKQYKYLSSSLLLKQNMNNNSITNSHKKIGTHNGKFHCDEVLACFLLRLLPRYKHAEIVRTRNEEILKDCDIVVDVGGIYDHEKLRYDHHQNTFCHSISTVLPNMKWTTKLSSAGLIYAHYGEEIIAKTLDVPIKSEVVNLVFNKLYENFVEEIDAVDNGIHQNEEPNIYRITTTISQRVSRLFPSWKEKSIDAQTFGFYKAMEMVGKEFLERLHFYGGDFWESKSYVKEAIESRMEIAGANGPHSIIELKSGGVPWSDHLFSIEEEKQICGEIKFVIFTDENGFYRVQAVPIVPGSFTLRIPLLKDWQGFRGEELDKISGIKNTVFVHGTGFIGGTKEREGAIEMAKISIQKMIRP